MVQSRFTRIKTIPNISTGKSSPSTTNFADGISTYKPNDTMKNSELRLAQDARFDRIGEYKTRRGYKRLGNPIGYANLSTNLSSASTDTPIADVQPYTFAGSNATLFSAKINIKKSPLDVYAVPSIGLYRGDDLISEAFIDPSTITTNYQTIEAVFMDAPTLSSGNTYTIKLGTQESRESTYVVQTVSGVLGCTVSSCTAGGVSNVFEANINGTKTILFVHNGSLYRMAADNTNTKIRDLPAGVTKVRFNQDLNQIRYADGKEGPRLLNPANSWADTAITTTDLKTGTDLNIKVSNILDGTADNMFYFDADTDTQAVWTYPYGFSYNNTPINSYDKFDRDFYQNFPAIQTGDPLTAVFNLGGVYYILTRRNKYQMYAQTADQWNQSQCTAQNGTFSQESLVCDLNYAYFANDTGIYCFNGMDEESITQNTIQNVYDAIPNKEKVVLDLYNNRLYVYYPSTVSGPNDHCLVYNINLQRWESFDTNGYVSATSARQNSSNRFLCGHSKIGLIMINEDETNNYSDLNSAVAFNLETAYEHFGTTSQLKRIPKWRPEFATTVKPYSVKCGYALDYTDNVKYAFSVDLQNLETVGESYVWDEPSNYGVPTMPTRLSTIPQINGEFYRCQLRYQHIAAYEPVTFRSHTVTVQTQRIR
jgi:hypothetical protein